MSATSKMAVRFEADRRWIGARFLQRRLELLLVVIVVASSVACAGPPAATNVSLVPNPNESVPLAGILTLTADRPVIVSLEIADQEHRETVTPSSEPRSEIELPVLGLRPNRTHTVTVTLRDERGREAVLDPIEIQTPPLPDDMPPISVPVRRPGAMEPGVTLLHYFRWQTPFEEDDHWGIAAAVDAEGEVLWYYKAEHPIDELERLPNGNFFYAGGQDGRMYEIDMLGNIKRRWHTSGVVVGDLHEDSIPVATDTFHHEVIALPSGNFLALGLEVRELENYPQEYPPSTRTATDLVSSDELVEFTPAGEIVRKVKVLDVLDPYRLGYGSLGRNFYEDIYEDRYDPMPVDHTHSNAIDYVPADDSVVVSSNFQAVIYKVDMATGELEWLLGDPAQWREPWSQKLLKPKGDVGWPYHQHGLELTPRGTYLLFDNGGERSIPPDPGMPPEEAYSRAVEYRVDEAAGTVEEVWSYGPEQEKFISPFISDADHLPETGNILVTDGGKFADQDGNEMGTFGGRQWARVFEVTYGDDSEKVWELVTNDPAKPYSIYRAQRIRSLYPELDRPLD